MLCKSLSRGLLQHSHHLRSCSRLAAVHLNSSSSSSSSSRSIRVSRHSNCTSFPAVPTAAASLRMSTVAAGAAAAPTQATAAGLLAAQEDKYDGIIIDHEQLPSDPQEFQAALQQSLQVWAQQGKRGVWLKVSRELSQLIPVAVQPGFTFHHAEQDYVMMTKWLPTDAPNTLPPNASHQVGVGAIVVNEKQQLLVVQEANGPLRGQGVWKMPTGLVHAGEDLIEAVEREVLEETGVQVKFDCVIAVRQAHGFAFGKSDLFFCCGCRPVGSLDVLKACEREIAALSWISFDEYMAQPFFAKMPLPYHTLINASKAWAEGHYSGMQGRVFEGTAARPRRDLLLWSAAAEGLDGTSPSAVAVLAGSSGNGTSAVFVCGSSSGNGTSA